MLDIKFIREHKDLVKEGARKKHMDVDVDRLIEVDDKRRELLSSIEEKRAEQNTASQNIAGEQDEQKRNEMITRMKTLKEELQKEEEQMQEIMQEWQQLMVQVPNIPDVSVPEGESDEENQELRRVGEPPQFSFAPKSHIELMREHDMADFERGSKVAGFRGYFLKNAATRLIFAIWQMTYDQFMQKGEFVPMLAPSLIRREPFLGTGYLPQSEEDLYKTQDDLYLAGTAEVPIMGYYMDERLERTDLPKKMFAFSPCFRREAGSYGKDTKGLMRLHEFFKFEQVILCEASHETSVQHHEEIERNVEEMMEMLELPYRVVTNCGGDLGLGQVKKYDVELWIPSEGQYREISSASYFHDFQTRRLNIKYRDKDNTLRYAHSLNSTAMPTPRVLISLLENNQREDGSIAVPKALQPYIGSTVLGTDSQPHAHQNWAEAPIDTQADTPESRALGENTNDTNTENKEG